MEVSKSSWHYRMTRLILSMWSEGPGVFEGTRYNYRPKNLCAYFWTTVAMLISVPIWVPIALIAGIGLGLLFCAFLVWDNIFADRWEARQERKKSEEAARRKERMEAPAQEPKRPNILISWLKARKAKACPVIKLVD